MDRPSIRDHGIAALVTPARWCLRVIGAVEALASLTLFNSWGISSIPPPSSLGERGSVEESGRKSGTNRKQLVWGSRQEKHGSSPSPCLQVPLALGTEGEEGKNGFDERDDWERREEEQMIVAPGLRF